MSETVRLGIAGLKMGRGHLRAAESTPGVEVAAVAEPDPERVKDGFEFAGVEAPVYDDYRKMIEDDVIDGVIIALPTDMHAESSTFALEHGTHVLCEKPPTTSVEEMRVVADVADRSGQIYMFARQPRFNRNVLCGRALVAAGRLGNVYHSEAKWIRARNIPLRGGWGVNKDAGGGVLLDLGIHALDTAWFIMGCPKPASVSAVMHCAFSRFATPDLTMPYNADDSTFALVRFENGASLALSVTFALNVAPNPAFESKKPFPEWQECSVFGELSGFELNGCRLLDNSGEALAITDVDPWLGFDGDRESYTALGAQVAEFARAIRDDDEPMNTANQAIALMEMLDAMKRSAESGASVEIEND